MSTQDTARGRQRMALRKGRRENRIGHAIGTITLHRRSRETGELLGVVRRQNAIVAMDRLMELVAGTSDGHLDTAHTSLRFTDTSGGTPVYDHVGADVGPTSAAPTNSGNGYRLRWEFNDETATARSNLEWAELWNSDPADQIDGAAGGEMGEAITRTNCGFGDKPATENWYYSYEIEFYSSDGDIETQLHQDFLHLIIGSSSDHFTTATVGLQPRTSADADVGSEISAGGRSVGSNYLEFSFTSADGQNNGAWDKAAIRHSSADVRVGGAKQDGSGAGTKSSGEEWSYTWRYTLS